MLQVREQKLLEQRRLGERRERGVLRVKVYHRAYKVPDSPVMQPISALLSQPDPIDHQRSSSQPAPATRIQSKAAATAHQRHHHHDHDQTKPANGPHVISSIIASFQDVAPPMIPASDTQPSRTYGAYSSYHFISSSASRSAPPTPSPKLRRSVSLGVDTGASGTRIEEEDEDSHRDGQEQGQDEAAEFPVVRTSRRPSGKSPHTSSPSSPSRPKAHWLPATRNSKSTLSLNGLDIARPKLGRSSSRLSVESWARRLSTSQVSLESSIASLSPTKATSRRSSKDTLKPREVLQPRESLEPKGTPKTRETLKPRTGRQGRLAALIIDPTLDEPTKAVPIAAAPSPRTPTLARTSPTGRLYLDDTSESEVVGARHISAPRTEENARAAVAQSSSFVNKTQTAGRKSSTSQRNPIADAIPLRVSSLNRTTPPRQHTTKSGRMDKGKRAAATPVRNGATTPASVQSPQSDTFDDLFGGLDERDTTVKRIIELKQKKEDRLKKEYAAAERDNDFNYKLLPNSSTDVKPSGTSRSDRQNSMPKAASRVTGREAGARKAHQVLGLNGASKSAQPSTTALSDYRPLGRKVNPELIKQLPPNSSNERPASAQTPGSVDAASTSRRTLPFSDARATNSVQATQHSGEALTNRTATTTTRLRLLDGIDLEPSDLTPPSTSHSTRSRLSRSNSNNLDRWSRSDLSVQAEGLNQGRRKSMSDARNEVLVEETIQERRNSVTASVEGYLGAPRLNQKIRSLHSGRLISFSEVGDPAGAAVIVCVGMGLTRYVTAFYDELAATLGLRLITLDRPGVGESEPYPERERVGPLSWPDDVVAVTQHLKISQFSVLAHSAGAIYALATALILPHCIRGKVQLLAPWIPPSQFDTFGLKDLSPDATPVGALPRSQRLLRVLPIPFLKAANGGLFSPSSLKPSSVRSSPSPSPSPGRDTPRGGKPKRRPDPVRRESMILMDQVLPEKPVNTMFPLPEIVEDDLPGKPSMPSLNLTATATPTDPDLAFVAEAMDAAEHSARERRTAYSSLLTERTWTLATRNSNPAVDLLVCLERNRDIGFRYVDIQRQIVITHGSEDKRVPVENIRWIGEQINRRAATNWSPDAKQEFRERGGCEVRVLPGEGHGLMASPGVMADVLTEIGREWTATKW